MYFFICLFLDDGFDLFGSLVLLEKVFESGVFCFSGRSFVVGMFEGMEWGVL